MARRARKHRQEIPGYDENKPTREERKQQHRATRHATNQMLHTLDDPEDIVLPQERRTRSRETGNEDDSEPNEPKKRRFRVWKTKFWKRRDEYREQKAALDSNWPVITPNQIQEE